MRPGRGWTPLRWLLVRLYRIPPHTSPMTPAHLDLPAEDVELSAVDGSRLRGWFLPATGVGRAGSPSAPHRAGPAVVVLHGWGSAAADLLPAVPALVEAGLPTLLVDARGHGRSDPVDVMSMPRFAEDAGAAVRWLRADPRVDPDRIALVGHSVGAGACLLAAADDPRIAAVVAIASMAHPAELMGQSMRTRRVPAWLGRAALRVVQDTIGHRFDDFAPIHTITRVRAPVLVVHGLEDTTVPPQDAVRLAEAGPTAILRLVPGAGHDRLEDVLPVLPEMVDHLQAALGVRAPGR